MAYTTTEQGLYDHLRQSLPRFLFQSDTAPEEIWGAYVKIFDAARTQTTAWLAQSYIKTATGAWLDQHAKDRGTGRANGESDATLRARLVNVQDAVTYPALLSGAQATTTAGGSPTPAVAIVELRRDKAFMDDSAAGHSQAFLSRGYRMGAIGRPMNIIVILPFGTSAATQLAVSEYLRRTKAAGYKVTVEVRAVP